jgi:hypothetical protein
MTLEEKVTLLVEQSENKQLAKSSKKFYLFASFLVLFGGLFATYRLVGFPQGVGIFASSSSTPEAIQITQVGIRSFTITWKTGTATTGYLKYGTSVESKDKIAFDDKASTGDKRGYTSTTHQVTVNNAAPNQLYFYSLVSKGTEYAAADGSIFTPIKTLAEDGTDTAAGQAIVPAKSGFSDLIN